MQDDSLSPAGTVRRSGNGWQAVVSTQDARMERNSNSVVRTRVFGFRDPTNDYSGSREECYPCRNLRVLDVGLLGKGPSHGLGV